LGQIIGNLVFTAQGLLLGICDEKLGSPAASLNDAAWKSTSPTSPDRLFEYNTYLMDRQRAGSHATWPLVLWGTFRIEVELHHNAASFESSPDSVLFIGNINESVIDLPTGTLGLLDVEVDSWQPISKVSPGRYRIRVTGSEEPSHWDIESPTDYPLEDHNWVIHLLPESN
jgi:hypothetical protein